MAFADCTDKGAPARIRRSLLTLALVALTAACLAAGARADGDPASDVLLGQSLFLPQDAGAHLSAQSRLAALLATAQREGYRIRVAVIASPADLGSVTALWRRPQAYARFLGTELSIVYRGALLVVMPDGYGLAGVGGASTDSSALDGLSRPGSGLAPSAIAAVRRLAPRAGVQPRQLTSSRFVSPGSDDSLPWIVFAAGLILIALAWTVSLRAQPLGSTRPSRTRSP